VINDNHSFYKLILVDTPTISVVKPNIPEVYTETVTPVQNTLNQTNPDKNTSTDETVSQVMLKEVLEDVQIFQLQLDDILKLSLNTSKLKVRKISSNVILYLLKCPFFNNTNRLAMKKIKKYL